MTNELEEVRCNLCSSTNHENLYFLEENHHRFSIVRCCNCGLVYLNPRLKQAVLNGVYSEDTLSNFNYYLQNKELDEKTFLSRLGLIKKYLGNGGKVLDIGSSIGTFMCAAKKMGFNPYGIELNKKSAEYSIKEYGFKLFKNLEQIKTKFSLINLSDIIEHLPDPRNILGKIWNLLEDDGLILVSTPDFSNKLTRKLAMKPLEHLYYFDSKTLRHLLNICGFEILFISPTNRKLSVKTLIFSSTFNKSGLKLTLLNFLVSTKLYLLLDFMVNRLNPDLLVIAKKVTHKKL